MSFSVLDAAREAPSALALVVGDHRLTYAALAERVRERMETLGRHGKTVAFVAAPDLETFLTVYACLELRLPFAPIHARLPPEERGRRLEESAGFQPVGGEASALAFLYTSGTGGKPQAIELSRSAFAAAAAASAERLGWQPHDRWLLALSLAHVGGLAIVVRCLLGRRPVVSTAHAGFEPGEVLALLSGERVTLCSLVPAQLERLLTLRDHPPPALRAVLLGGAAARPDLLRRAQARGWPVFTTYGLTETCSQVATQGPGTSTRGVGEALEGVEVRIVEGRIQVRSPALMTAYHPGGRRPASTADGWFPTQDLGRLEPDGTLHVIGRSDDVIVTGGEKVIPGEVEAALEACAGVAAACAFGIDDPIWGQLVAAAIVPLGRPPAPSALTNEIRPRLATFQRPRRIAFLEALLLTPTGKVDRSAVRRAAMERLTPLSFD